MRSTIPFLVAVTLAAAPAVGQPRPNPAAPMSAEARAAYEVGGRYYTVRRFDDAAREFQTAYALSGRPELLFNIGRAFEDGGHSAQALDAYERFLRQGAPGVDRALVEARLAAVRRALEASRAQPTTAPIPPPAAPAVAVPGVRPPVVPPPPAPSRAVPLSLLIGGGVALGTALVLGATVISTDAELASVCTNGVCPADRAADISSGNTRAIVADVVGVIGLAAITTGVILWVTQSPRATARRPALHFGCTPSSCGAAAEVRF